MSLTINLTRPNKTFTEGETVRGYVEVDLKKGISHNGLKLSMEAFVVMSFENSNYSSVWDSIRNGLKPVSLIDFSVQLLKPGKLPAEKTQIPFEFELQSTSGQKLHETYHGVYNSIRYKIHAVLSRKLFSSDLKKTTEFVVHAPGQGYSRGDESSDSGAEFEMTPDKLENVKSLHRSSIPSFHVIGKLDRTTLGINEAITGMLRVTMTEKPIRSIELQLVRVESCHLGDRSITEPTEIQNLQIGDGDVIGNLDIPIYMIPPRLFSCPTLITKSYSIEFELNIIVLFQGGHQVTENFPIHFYRLPTDVKANNPPSVY